MLFFCYGALPKIPAKKLQPETPIAVYRFMQDKIFAMPFLQKRLFPACR